MPFLGKIKKRYKGTYVQHSDSEFKHNQKVPRKSDSKIMN